MIELVAIFFMGLFMLMASVSWTTDMDEIRSITTGECDENS